MKKIITLEPNISALDIIIFTRHLATLVTAGLPLVKSLEVIGESIEKITMQNLISTIKTDVASGQSFSQVLKNFPQYFDKLYCGLIACALQSGTLGAMLTRIADYLEKSAALTKKIKKALIYPAAVLFVSFLVATLLLIFIVPQFATLFDAYGAKLPVFTRMVLTLSEIIQQAGWLILLSFCALIIAFKLARKKWEPFQNFLDRFILKLAGFGLLIKHAIIARTTRTLSTMLAAGIPLIDALTAVANSAGNTVFSEAFQEIRNDVSTGQTLHQAMRATALFPPMVIQMIAIGEESGSLAAMLNNIASFHEEDVDSKVATLSSLIEPLIMLILGIIIGGFVLAMYMPIFKLGSVF